MGDSHRCPTAASFPEVETTRARENPGTLMEGVVLSGSKRNKDFKNQRLALRSPSGLAQVTARRNLPSQPNFSGGGDGIRLASLRTVLRASLTLTPKEQT